MINNNFKKRPRKKSIIESGGESQLETFKSEDFKL